MKVLVATRSDHKMAEIRRILGPIEGVSLLSLAEAGVAYTPEEDELEPFDTFEANARSKARYFEALTGLPTVADDSGIEVDALAGAPGVRSKRFAPTPESVTGEARDQANNRHLLSLLEGKAPEARTARYVCVAALEDGREEGMLLRGEAAGVILVEPRGEAGFGYDPLFLDPELGRTFAEISPDEKDARSHRGAAFRRLAEALRAGMEKA